MLAATPSSIPPAPARILDGPISSTWMAWGPSRVESGDQWHRLIVLHRPRASWALHREPSTRASTSSRLGSEIWTVSAAT